MSTHSSVLAWGIPMDRGAWQATVHGVTRVGHDLGTKPPPSQAILQKSVRISLLSSFLKMTTVQQATNPRGCLYY